MITSAVKPAAFARARKLAATALSCGQYSWYQRWPSPLASATSSIAVDDAVLRTMGTPWDAAALATAASPPGCAMPSTPTGASRNGTASSAPSTVLAYDGMATSVSIRGTIRQRRKASRFSLAVSPEPALPAM